MSDQKPVNGHPNPFTLEPLDTPAEFQPLSAADVAELRALQDAETSRRRNIAHRAEGNRGDVHVKQSRDRAQYVRQQKGHSFILHWLVLGIFSCFIVPIYYSVSPNHYWHI